MRTRLLPLHFGVVFALTLFFVTVAGAQDEDTDAEGAGTQTVEIQQQQVQNNQQQVGTLAVETQAQGCQGQRREFEVGPKSSDTNRDFHIEGGKFRVVYDVNFAVDDPDNNQFNLNISNGSKFFNTSSTGNNHEEFVIDRGPGDFTLEARLRPQANGNNYTITVYDCKDTEPSNNNGGGNGGGGGGGDGGGRDGGGNNSVGVAQQNTVPDTTTSNLNTANPETTAADANLNADFANRPNAGNFRCDLFLRTVRDDTGALRDQYRGDEQIVQRFEQCLSEDVLADTIPNRNLPFTGGMSLLFLGAIGLAAIVAGAAVLRAVMRRAG